MSKAESIDKLAEIYMLLMNIDYGDLTDIAKKQVKTAYADGMKAALNVPIKPPKNP